MTMNNQMTTRTSQIEERIDRGVTNTMAFAPNKGLIIESFGQAMEFAKAMSISGVAVPKHLRDSPGACLAICIQAYEWSINPFALANKSYSVNDRLSYEASIFHAVVSRRAPIRGRIKLEYAGKDQMRTCRVWAHLSDEDDIVEYTSPEIGKIPVKNSPLWKGDPDQQLFYSAVRAFARRHFPDVMMGIYTVDEMLDAPPPQTVVVGTTAADLAARLSAKRSDDQVIEPAVVLEQAAAEAQAEQEQATTGETIESERGVAPAINVDSWATTVESCHMAAKQSGMADVAARLDMWRLAGGWRRKEEAIPVPLRYALVEAVAEGRLQADGKVTE